MHLCVCLSHYWLVKADDGVVAEVQGVQLQPRQRRAQVASTQRKQLLNKHTHIYINHWDFDRAVHALSDTSWQMRRRRRVPPGSWGSSNMWRPPAESKPPAAPPDSVEGFASAGEEETKRCSVSETEEEGGLEYLSMWWKVLIYKVEPKNQLRSFWNCAKGKVFILYLQIFQRLEWEDFHHRLKSRPWRVDELRLKVKPRNILLIKFTRI